jgi:predicted DNA-binding protein
MQTTEYTVRSSKRMQRVIESAIESQIKNKKTFIQDSVTHNIEEIVSYVEGQKSLRDFILNLNDNVEWLHMEPPNYNIRDRIELENELVVNSKINLNDTTEDMVKAASRYTGEPKSSIIRVCIIKELYNNRDQLVKTNADTITDVWMSIRRKFKVSVEMLINKLYFNLEQEFINSKIGRIEEIGNLMAIRDFYQKFKQTEGYQAMSQHHKGAKVINILKEVEEFIDGKEN